MLFTFAGTSCELAVAFILYPIGWIVYPVSAPENMPNTTTTPLIPEGTYTYTLSGSFSGSSGNSGSVNAITE